MEKAPLTVTLHFIENRQLTQQTSSSDIIENQTERTVICAVLTDPQIQPDQPMSADDADPHLPKIIADPKYTTENEKEKNKGKATLS